MRLGTVNEISQSPSQLFAASFEKSDNARSGLWYKHNCDTARSSIVYKVNNNRLGTKKFVKLKVPKVKTASKAIGIAEIREYLKKKIELSEVIEKISIKTRQYAKRQSTWGRGNMMDWNKIKSEDLNKFLKKI